MDAPHPYSAGRLPEPWASGDLPEPFKPWTWGHGSFDWETFSAAGFVWDETSQSWKNPKGAGSRQKGLGVVGANAYTEHPSARVLTLSYRLPTLWYDLRGAERWGGNIARWRPGQPPPQDLFDFIAAGGILEAFNVMFERLVWANICVPKYGWPPLEPHAYQLRCAMAKARVACAPGRLKDAAEVLATDARKNARGKVLLDKFSIPRKPTKKDPRTVIVPPQFLPGEIGSQENYAAYLATGAPGAAAYTADAADFEELQRYCDDDIRAEDDVSAALPDMTPDELEFWWIDQEINWRGVAIDREGVRNCIVVMEQAFAQYGDEFRVITGGLNPTQGAELRGWLAARGFYTDSLDEEHRADLLKRMPPHPPGVVGPVRRVVEIVDLIGSASVKKLYAMENQACNDDRLRNLLVHHGARTGRPTGEGPQPLNLPRDGPALFRCPACAGWSKPAHLACPWCATDKAQFTDKERKPRKWSTEGCQAVLDVMKAQRLDLVEWYFGDALAAISGCLRGLFVAGPGRELIASDFSAIEAVVMAMLAGEQWRIDTFKARKDIYLAGAAMITGRTYEWYIEYAAANDGVNHDDRQKIGKVSELALGFGGWIGAWRNFDKSDNFTDDQVKANIVAWRAASPAIVEFWGGQSRGLPWDENCRPERYGLEGAAVNAIENPGQVFTVSGISYFMRGPHLICRLRSDRELTYRNATVIPASRKWATAWEKTICYWTWNTNPTQGPMGWVPMTTYGPKLAENVVQAVAHCILRFAIKGLRMAGYPCVLHVYDEVLCEIPLGSGSQEEFDRVMATLPSWAEGWPVRVEGWRAGLSGTASRYRK